MTGIERAVEIAGSQEALAAICGVKQPAVSKWVNRGHAPLCHSTAIWRATKVPRIDLVHPNVREIVRDGPMVPSDGGGDAA